MTQQLRSSIREALTLPEEARRGSHADQAGFHMDTYVSSRLALMNAQEQAEAREFERRKKSGKYGICKDCGQPIAENRLRAKPFAVRCIGCEERLSGN